MSKSGRYGGAYGHNDITFEFASWISPPCKLYLIKEFQRLKREELHHLSSDRISSAIWQRSITDIHTDAIRENFVPEELSKEQINSVHASEADVLNMALFGPTAKQWRMNDSGHKGNIRDCADINQLVCLSNLANLNARFIHEYYQEKNVFWVPKDARWNYLQSSAALPKCRSYGQRV